MVSADPRSTTCGNLRYLRELTTIENAEYYSSKRVRDSLPVQKVPEKEMWHVWLLTLTGFEVREVQVGPGHEEHLCHDRQPV